MRYDTSSVSPSGCHLPLKGSDGSAAGGGRSDLSEWQRSARDEGALAPRTFAGHRNRRRPWVRWCFSVRMNEVWT